MSCSAIVPVWNLTSPVRQALGRLVDATAFVAEVIVVDATKNGQLLAWLHGVGTRARRVPADPEATVPAARNVGAAVATGSSLLFGDPEDVLRDGAVAAMLACADRFPHWGVVGGKVLAVDETVLQAGAVFGYDRLPRPLYRGLPASHPAVNRSHVVQAVGGGPLLVRRDAFERVDGFDRLFTRACFDEDLCLRLAALGYEAIYCHDCVASREVMPASDLPLADTGAFVVRWASLVRQDDVERYMRDGLLRLTYESSGTRRLSASPLLAVVDDSGVAVEAGLLLAARARQVQELSLANAALTARASESAPAPKTFSETMAALVPPPADYREPAGDELVPPYALELSIGGRFREDGDEFFRHFRELAGIEPSHRVLDVGCGAGRMAVKLAPFLTTGSYEGFDIRADVIDWCQRHITPRYPRARFAYVDLANGAYNAAGATQSAQFAFPYPPASFDFVLLTSVFTHMLPADVDHYLAEIAAVLAPGGTCFITYFLINDESLGLIRGGMAGSYNFSQVGDGYRSLGPGAPEFALAYEEAWIRQRHDAHGLRIVEPIHYGSWCGRQNGVDLQDIVIARKEPAVA